MPSLSPRWRAICTAVLAAGLLCPAARASEQAYPWRMSVGGSYTTLGNVAPFVALHKPFADWRGFRLEAAAGAIGKHRNARPQEREHVGWIAVGLARSAGRWEGSLSVAASYPRTSALSSVGQFLSQVSYRLGQGYALRLGHLSNASLHGRNRGETFLALTVDLQ